MTKELLLSPPNSRGGGMTPRVVKRLEREIQDEEAPLISKLVTWRNLLTFVDEGESLLLDCEENAELKKWHHTILESSIVLGQFLLEEKGITEALQELHYTVDDFKAKIEMLRHKDRLWHGDLSSDKANQILNSVFGG
jgi:hypothetical protein